MERKKKMSTLIIITRYFFLVFIFSLLIYSCSEKNLNSSGAQTKEYYFSKVFGEYDAEMGYSIHSTNDNGYIISGATSSYWATDSLPARILEPAHGVTDAIIAKVDRNGDYEWVKTYGGENYESAFNAKQTEDGGFIFMGYTASYGLGLYDFWLVKLDQNGSILWQKTYGDANSNIGLYGDICSDNGFVLVGSTVPEGRNDRDIWLIKTDLNGDIEWSQTYGDSSIQSGSYLKQTQDDGFIILGSSLKTETQTDINIIKVDEKGIVQWQKQIVYAGNDVPYAIKEDDNGYVVAATTTSLGAGDKDIFLIKLDQSGTIIWERTYGGAELEYGFDVFPGDDGYVVVGSTSSFGTMFYDIWILKVDFNGEEIWNQIFSGENIDIGRAIIGHKSGGYTVLAQTSSYGAGEYDFWILKLNENGIVPEN